MTNRDVAIFFLLIVLSSFSLNLYAQDLRERTYLYEVLNPKHQEKPLVKGWAAHRSKEVINRGLIAQDMTNGSVYLSWRLLESDPENVAFNVFRIDENGTEIRLNKKPVVSTTDFTDVNVKYPSLYHYRVETIVEVTQFGTSEKVNVIPLNDGYSFRAVKLKEDCDPNRIAVADLNGDGAFDFIVKHPNYGIDPGGRPNTDSTTYKIDAYLSDGTFLWRKDLGLGIEPGIWYSPMIAYDLNGDGKAEVALKTGPNQRDADGRVREGEEWVSVLDGMTGKEIARVNWPERSPRYGDYNRNSRNQMGIAYLDGKTPALLVARGTYKLMVCDAWQLIGNELELQWHWDGDEENPVIRSQGAHGMHCTDVDADGRDEILLGAVMLDDNGTALWSAGVGHTDKAFMTDIDSERPGLEVFFAVEPFHKDGRGVCLVDAATGKQIWNIGIETFHVGDGMVADVDPQYPGLECFASEDPKGGSHAKYMRTAQGKTFGNIEDFPGCRNWIWWDGDLLRESVKGGRWRRDTGLSIGKFDGTVLTEEIRGRLMLMADLVGDWREELVTVEKGKIRIYSTILPAVDRRVTLMQDPLYRNHLAHRSMGYEQSPVPSFYLGE
ncbi:silent information regulator protein Sir2 [Marinilabilia salmonicolor]|uniref:Rhamnogalacturonan endolyase n=1 Tax=Marinilabilia salmonicolor TaxID=989 RepID=A0A368UUR6_9BACT|nr:silent information regulator protein Sir2 [Marinilabilia salmonicolor]RCW32542.1 rhamnogalacturonan endolyase [Marinilabilia salmonicolor]